MSSKSKTALLVVVCVIALAVAAWSGYRSFVPKGKVTYGGSFGSRDAERGADGSSADPLSGAPANVGEGGSGQGAGPLSGAPAGVGDRGR